MARSGAASTLLLHDLRSDEGMESVFEDMWLSNLHLDAEGGLAAIAEQLGVRPETLRRWVVERKSTKERYRA